MSEQTTLNQQRGEIVTSVEPDAVFLEARNARIQADAAYAKALEALAASQLVEANAANAQSQATTAISLANAAQTTANNALSTQVSITGATLTGPIYLSSTAPSAPYEAAAKGYVDAQVATVATDAINSVAVLKADKTYVDTQDAALQSQITSGAASITDLYSKLFPVGGIIMWSGTIASIPSGWALCNGTSGTPDLRDRFIIGAGSTFAPGNVGGTLSQTTNIAGAHTHGAIIDASGAHGHNITVNGTALTIAQIPAHGHDILWQFQSPSGGTGDRASYLAATGSVSQTQPAGGGQAHSHTASADTQGLHTHTGTIQSAGDHTHTVDVTPPYYALAFIMKL